MRRPRTRNVDPPCEPRPRHRVTTIDVTAATDVTAALVMRSIKKFPSQGSVRVLVNVVCTLRAGHDLKLYWRLCRPDVRKFFFSRRVVDNWNSLP